jgi:hypothetical protein
MASMHHTAEKKHMTKKSITLKNIPVLMPDGTPDGTNARARMLAENYLDKLKRNYTRLDMPTLDIGSFRDLVATLDMPDTDPQNPVDYLAEQLQEHPRVQEYLYRQFNSGLEELTNRILSQKTETQPETGKIKSMKAAAIFVFLNEIIGMNGTSTLPICLWHTQDALSVGSNILFNRENPSEISLRIIPISTSEDMRVEKLIEGQGKGPGAKLTFHAPFDMKQNGETLCTVTIPIEYEVRLLAPQNDSMEVTLSIDTDGIATDEQNLLQKTFSDHLKANIDALMSISQTNLQTLSTSMMALDTAIKEGKPADQLKHNIQSDTRTLFQTRALTFREKQTELSEEQAEIFFRYASNTHLYDQLKRAGDEIEKNSFFRQTVPFLCETPYKKAASLFSRNNNFHRYIASARKHIKILDGFSIMATIGFVALFFGTNILTGGQLGIALGIGWMIHLIIKISFKNSVVEYMKKTAMQAKQAAAQEAVQAKQAAAQEKENTQKALTEFAGTAVEARASAGGAGAATGAGAGAVVGTRADVEVGATAGASAGGAGPEARARARAAAVVPARADTGTPAEADAASDAGAARTK